MFEELLILPPVTFFLLHWTRRMCVQSPCANAVGNSFFLGTLLITTNQSWFQCHRWTYDSLYDHNLRSSGYFQPLKLVSQCDSSVHFNEHFSHQIWIHCLCMWQHVKHVCEKSAQIMQRYQVSRILKEKTSRDKERGIKHKLHLGKESKISKRDALKQQSRHFYSIKIKSMETTSSWVFLLWFLHL